MRATAGLTLFVSGIVLTACAPCDSSAALVARIESLASGERLDVGECVISEAVTVPAGAVVEHGVFELPAGASITLVPSADDAPVTTLIGSRVRGGAGGAGGDDRRDAASVRVEGPGRARIEGVELELARGIGIGVAQADVEIDRTQLVGNVDPEHPDYLSLSIPALPGVLATYGIAVVDTAHVTITSTSVRRMATAGVICDAATLVASDVAFSENRGFGLRSFGCTVTLTDADVHDTVSAPGLPGVGIDAELGTELTATRLQLHDAPGYGLLVRASEATLDAPSIARMQQAGAWAEDGAILSVTGGVLEDNAGAAIAAVGASSLEVRETRVTSTTSASIPSPGGGGAERMADAIHVAQRAGMPCTVTLAGLTLIENVRVGVVLDGAMEPLTVSIERTRIETSGTQLGAVAQDVAALPAAWDADIARVGSAATLDATAGRVEVSGGTGLSGILMPPTIQI